MSKSKRRDIPVFATPLIETHCHLDYLDAAELQHTLVRARQVGVERIVTIAVSAANLDNVLALTKAAPDIWGTQGIHPHEAEGFDSAVEARIRAHAGDPRIVAIGEIGLDYYYDHADRAVQRKVFAAQLALAVELDLPIVVHTREADEDTRAILAEYAPQLQRKGVIHSFTSGLPLAEFCLDAGFMLGFNGITTFNSADNVRAVVTATPLDQLVLETDAPYLTPVPYRGRPNAPFYLPFIAERIAEVLEIPVETLLQAAYRNSLALFFPATGE
ncbi:MAG TPA: TatD family deoxyribonuclease [Haliea salexigens]|uniref:TatD family deoxyribonuclease n=1 Tax=Haliea salexigens TaxID=287487 RepID=A0A3C1KPU4_9GAMM|nr:TatD family deoxyribonuclease [Haliea salexigens]|tara:strand:+ start:17059 stop:17877 length:819 start_codon:yes stop_codon:yes gene_type:complete